MSPWFRGLASVVVSAALICAPVTASAQDKEADNKAAAKEHWSRGTSFYDLGRYDQAITEFEAAYQLKNDPAFLFNLAQAYRMAGKHERAVHFYKTYLRYVPKAPNRADIEEKIKTGEQLAAQQAAGTLPPPTTTTPPPVTTTPPPGQTTPPPGGELGTVPTPPGELPPVETPPPGYVPPTTETTDRSGPQVPHRGAGDRRRGRADVPARHLPMAPRRCRLQRHRGGSPRRPAVRSRDAGARASRPRRSKPSGSCWARWPSPAGVGLWYYGNRLGQTSETTTWRIVLAPSLAPNQGGATLRITF